MVAHLMVDAAMSVFKKDQEDFCGSVPEKALSVDGTPTVVSGGETYRFKYAWSNSFMTLWGPMGVTRRVYQSASDKRSHVPLNAAWGMAGHFMTVEVREAVAFSSALVTPEVTHDLLRQGALFRPHPTQKKRCVEAIGVLTAPGRTAHLLPAQPGPDDLHRLPETRHAHWQRARRGGLQNAAQDPALQKRNAMDTQRRAAHPRPENLRQVQPMGRLLG